MVVAYRQCFLCGVQVMSAFLKDHCLEKAPAKASDDDPQAVQLRAELKPFFKSTAKHLRNTVNLFDSGHVLPVAMDDSYGNLHSFHPDTKEYIKSQNLLWDTEEFEDPPFNINIPFHEACWDILWSVVGQRFINPSLVENLPPRPAFFESMVEEDTSTTPQRRFFAWLVSGWITWEYFPHADFSLNEGLIMENEGERMSQLEYVKGLGWHYACPSDEYLPSLQDFVWDDSDGEPGAKDVAGNTSSSLIGLEHLPSELHQEVAQYLSFKDLLVMERVSKAWKSVVLASTLEGIWKGFCESSGWIPASFLGNVNMLKKVDWRGYFAACYQSPHASNRARIHRICLRFLDAIESGKPGPLPALDMDPYDEIDLFL
ncbi:hypothetical protein HDU67_009961 [Dinochytrium kinnereticum]|nr:hypothetical protein HDU67_009961 [Dinochytrium kinnereticum]